MPLPEEDISAWKKRSEIDYVPLFISLWITLNAWMKHKWNDQYDRHLINKLKALENGEPKDDFVGLIQGENPDSLTFRGYFVELYRALENANLDYDNLHDDLKDEPNKKISFLNCVIKRGNTTLKFESVIKVKGQHNKIKMAPDFWMDGNLNRLFAAYIEIVYQVRCLLFHGNLPLNAANERVIIHLYLTLSMIMKPLGR